MVSSFTYKQKSHACPVSSAGPNDVNITALQTDVALGWVSEPHGRGTWSLLYSCVGTLIACVYTAIHLNIPPGGERIYSGYLRKAKWVMIALLAPEIVAYTAFEQYYLGRKFLKKLLSKEEKNLGKSKNVSSESEFDVVYAHYTMMGGFAADVSSLHNVLKTATFTPDGILFLSSIGLVPHLNKEDIEDKSKLDLLGKMLASLQGIWSIGQAIERKYSGYPTTMLEVHTIVHVVCALALYMLWATKPLNVGVPTIVKFEGQDEKYLAFMLQLGAEKGDRSAELHPQKKWYNVSPSHHCGFRLYDSTKPASCAYGEPGMSIFREIRPKPANLVSVSVATDDVISAPSKSDIVASDNWQEISDVVTHYEQSEKEIKNLPKSCRAQQVPVEYKPAADLPVVCTMITGQSLNSGFGPGLDHNSGKMHHDMTSDSRSVKVFLTHKDVRRLNLAAAYIKESPQPPKSKEAEEGPDQMSFNEKVEAALMPLFNFASGMHVPLALRAPNMSGTVFESTQNDATYLSAAMATVPALYGSVHLGALTILFPSVIERLMWKISCYYLIAAAGLFGAWSLLKFGDKQIARVFKMENTLFEKWELFRGEFGYHFDGKMQSVVLGCFSSFSLIKVAFGNAALLIGVSNSLAV
ncbi:hypothetical protein SBOR_5773 [Sclerotinia borealis F-4128]|uniref:Uncharacterized protein n=1 Tax=Sclerotinia borealis (strain F-4128) TaxID=1432307 RepID=W9CAS2_SCLBF|nr:hypothetical protein SBOR_5773 [Sclerotinia borealis F-4128]